MYKFDNNSLCSSSSLLFLSFFFLDLVNSYTLILISLYRYTCFLWSRILAKKINASWIHNSNVSDLGRVLRIKWVLNHSDYVHATEISRPYALRLKDYYVQIHAWETWWFLWSVLKTDCPDLVDMITSPMDWLVFASEIDAFWNLHDNFESMSLLHIPISKNGRTDSLAK